MFYDIDDFECEKCGNRNEACFCQDEKIVMEMDMTEVEQKVVANLLPEPGSDKWEDMVDFMRADLENDMGYSKIIKAARDGIESEGKDFDEEYKKWKKERTLTGRKKSEPIMQNLLIGRKNEKEKT